MYTENEIQANQRKEAFTYHPPHGNQAGRYEQIRAKANEFSLFLNENCPVSRELSHAQTQLQSVVMFANASIACNEPAPVIEVSDKT